MNHSLFEQAKAFLQARHKNKIWRRVLYSVALVVVFVTTYMLILPAITMERTAICGKEEHTHTEECYAGTAAETKKIYACQVTSQNPVIHTHDMNCYDEEGNLICQLPEIPEHTHTDACYTTERVLVCGTDEGTTGAGFSDGSAALTDGSGIFDDGGSHVHTDACYETRTVLTCGLQEIVSHIHNENCRDEEGNLICTQPEILNHQHTEQCFAAEDVSAEPQLICGKEEHVHTEACYPQNEATPTPEAEVTVIPEQEATVTPEAVMTVTPTAETTAAPESEASITPQPEITPATVPDETAVLEDPTVTPAGNEAGDPTPTPEVPEDSLTPTPGITGTPEGNSSSGEDSSDSDDGDGSDEADMAIMPVTLSLDDDPGLEDPGIMPLTDNGLPVISLSGSGASYDPVTDQFSVDVRIDFQFNSRTGLPTADDVYLYTYPEGITISDDLVNKGAQNLYDGNKLAGTYQFIKNEDGTYSVQVIFNENYIQQSGDTVTGFVQFNGTFGKEDMNEEGNIVVGADDTVVLVSHGDITYPKDETENYNIDVSKSGSWVRDGGKLVYTVYVRTTKGTPDPVSFVDEIQVPDGLTIGTPTVTVEKETASYYYADWDKTWKPTDNNNWSEVGSITPGYADGRLELSLPGLIAEKEKDSNNNDCIVGEVYRVTYTYPVTDQTSETVSVENNVTVEAKDEGKGQIVTDSAESTVNVTKDFSYTVDKTGVIASDKPGYIKWTVTVNSNEVDISGASLTDDMLGLIEDSAKDIEISPSDGVDVTKGTDKKITGISFTYGQSGVNKNKYIITYYTPVEESWNDTTVTNNATFDPDPDKSDDEKKVSASVKVGGVKLGKNGSYNGTTNKIDWIITVNSGNLDIAGATLTDEMFSALSENEFTIEPATGYSFIKDTDNDNKITGISFTAAEDGKNTKSYIIKYSTAVEESVDGSPSSVTNSATLSPGEGKTGQPINSEFTVTPEEVQLAKGGSFDWNGRINWTVTVNEGNRDIAGAVLTDEMFGQLTSDSITVKDGNWQEVPVESGQYTIHVNETGKITGITFHAIGGTDTNTNKYVITYSTEALREWNDKIVHNEAVLTLDGKRIPGDTDVTVPADGSVAKSAGTASVSEDNTTLTIPWTVTLTIPRGGLPAGTDITDDVTRNQWNQTNTNQWMTQEQILAWGINLTWTDDNGNPVGETNTCQLSPEQVTFLASNGKNYTYEQLSGSETSTGEGEADFSTLTYTKFTISFPEGLIPPEGASKLTFTYSTVADISKAAVGTNTYYNYIKAGSRDAGASCTYQKPGVVKTDGNGSTDKTSVSNDGTLIWKIKATAGSGNKKLTLIDTLPDGVTLEGLQLTGWGNLNMDLTVNDGIISGSDSTNQYTVSGTFQGSVITLNIAPQVEDSQIQTGAEFTVIVTCKVSDAENQTETKVLTNTAEMKLDEDSIGSSNQTQEWSYYKPAEEIKVVDKSGSWDNNNRIMNYTVILNKEGRDLLEGSDTLTLTDTLSYDNQLFLNYPFSGTYKIDASLIQNSVNLYKAVWNEEQGKWLPGEVLTGWSWTYEAKTGEYEWDKHKSTNTITVEGIPDNEPLMFEYSYRVTSNVPEKENGLDIFFEQTFKNQVRLVGTEEGSSEISSKVEWEKSNSSAGVTTDKNYTFYKVEAGNYNVSLAGAVFSVYKYDSETNGYSTEPVKTYETDDDGSYRIVRQEKDTGETEAFTYDYNTLYKVVETAPPEGYKLPEEVKTFWFYFSDTQDTTHSLPDDIPSEAVNLSLESKTVYVENVKNTTEITVEKKWKDSGGNETIHNSGSVTVNLYQKTGQSGGSGGETGENSTVEINVTKASWSSDLACEMSQTVNCRTGTVFTLTVSSWGTPVISINGETLTSDSRTGSGPFVYTYSFTVDGDITVNGHADDNNVGKVTYTYVEPVITTTPEDTGGSSGDVPETTVYKTVSLNKDNSWTYTFTNLPLTGIDSEGNPVIFYYYIREVSVPNYETSYSENNNGIQSGIITVTNKATDTPSYELPETGGPGTKMYTLGGLLLSALAVLLMYKQEKRRREVN